MRFEAAMTETLGQLRERIRRHPQLDEQNTRASLIDPLFRALGWDMEDPDEVRREYKQRPSDGPVDYALFVGGEPRLFIEAKKLGSNLDERRWATQVVGYAATAGIEWVVLTDGDEYRIYNSHAAVPVEQKLLCVLHVAGAETTDMDALGLLSKDRVLERHIDEVWQTHFVDQQVVSALSDLFSPEPDAALVRLLRKRLEALRPADIKAALRRIHVDFAAAEPARTEEQSSTPTPAAGPAETVPTALPESDYTEAIGAYLLASGGAAATLGDIRGHIEKTLPLSEADRAPNAQGVPVWMHRVASALSGMKRRGEVLNPDREVWQRAVLDDGEDAPSDINRRSYDVGLTDLIEAGMIAAPLQIEATYHKQRVTAVVQADGQVELNGERFSSLSLAGGRARGLIKGDGRVYPTNGWDFWRAHDTDGSLVKLAELRNRLMAQR